MEQETRTEAKKSTSLKLLGIVITIVLAISGYAAAYYYYNQYKETKIVLDNPETASKNEVKEVTDKLGKIYNLPKDEEPTVATVLDKEKLVDQPFFADSENGDKVVIYTKSQLAILFRISENKIINISPVSLEQPSTVAETDKPKAKASEAPELQDAVTPQP